MSSLFSFYVTPCPLCSIMPFMILSIKADSLQIKKMLKYWSPIILVYTPKRNTHLAKLLKPLLLELSSMFKPYSATLGGTVSTSHSSVVSISSMPNMFLIQFPTKLRMYPSVINSNLIKTRERPNLPFLEPFDHELGIEMEHSQVSKH